MHKRPLYKPLLQELSKEEISLKVKEWMLTHEVEKLKEQSGAQSAQVGIAARAYGGSYFSVPRGSIHRTVGFDGVW